MLPVLETDRGCFSCVLGGPDGRTFLVVASEWAGAEAGGAGEGGGVVLTERVDVPGVGW